MNVKVISGNSLFIFLCNVDTFMSHLNWNRALVATSILMLYWSYIIRIID